jgi:hypothetical protein
MKLRATLELHGKTATGFEVPAEVVESLGSGKRPAVTVTIHEHSYRTTISRMGGVFLIPVSAENRGAAGITAGETVEMDIVLDTAPRTVEVPADLAVALASVPGARAAFDSLSFTFRREHASAVEGAKAAATRERRITKIVSTLTPAD